MHVRGIVRTDERVLREATALLNAGFSVTIVDVENDQCLPAVENIKGIHVRHIIKPHWLQPTHGLQRIFQLAEKFVFTMLETLRVSADVYHAHDINALPACYIASVIRCSALVFDAHELPLSGMNNISAWLYSLLKMLIRIMLIRCAAVITVSTPIAQEICSRYHVSKVWLVRNMLAYQEAPQSDRLRQHLNLGPEIRIALYQGNLQADRGLDNLVRSAKFLKQDNVIVMMGKAIGETQSELEALIADEKVTDHIKILPPVPYAELLDWTSSANIGLIIYPPHYSLNVQMCLPNKLFEYLMAGLPVLATPLDAVSLLLETYDVGRTVPSLKPMDVAAAINAMLESDADLGHMRQNALSAVQKDLCWEQERQELIHLYQKIFC